MARRTKPIEVDDETASMDEWIRAQLSRKDSEGKRLAMLLSEGDWIALRCLLEEFPRETETPAQHARRQEVVLAHLAQQPEPRPGYTAAWTLGLELEALRADRERNAALWPGESYRDLAQLPWRCDLLASGRVSRRDADDDGLHWSIL